MGRKRSRLLCDRDIQSRVLRGPTGKVMQVQMQNKLLVRSIEHDPDMVKMTHVRRNRNEPRDPLWTSSDLSGPCMHGLKLKRKKSVRFAKGAKSWDGVANTQGKRDFDDLLFHFFVRREKVGDADILNWTRGDLKRVDAMRRLLEDLRNRISSASTDTLVPCLPQGGGKSLRLHAEHLPYLTSLMSVLDEAVRALGQHQHNR